MNPHWRAIVSRLLGWPFLPAVLFAFLNLASIAYAQQTTFTIGGTGSTLGAMRQLGQAFEKANPGITVNVLSSLGSTGGIKAALSGAVDVGVSARPLTDAERGQGAVAIEYARAPLVFAVSEAVGTTNITMAQLVDIYAGRLIEWPDGTPIRLVLRPAGDIFTIVLKSISPQLKNAIVAAEKRPGMLTALTDQDAIENIDSITGSVGPTTPNQIITDAPRVRMLRLDGIQPSAAAIADGSYRYYLTYYLVTGKTSTTLAERFNAFVRSEPGRKILADTGHWVSGTTALR